MPAGPPPLVDNLGPAGDPTDLVARFLDLPYLLFLDSATGPALAGEGHQLSRYSFLSADPAVVIRSKGRVTEIGGPDRPWTRLDADPLLAARERLAPFATAPVFGLPPFQGGVAGYIGYDYGAVLERLPAPRYDDLAIPDVMLGLYDWVIAWDHRLETAWIVSTGLPGDRRGRRPSARGSGWRWCRSGSAARAVGARPSRGRGRNRRVREAARPVVSRRRRRRRRGDRTALHLHASRVSRRRRPGAGVHRRRRHLPGEPLAAASRRRSTEPPFELYRRLRRRNPAPFAAYLDFGDLAVLSASPERFLRVDGRRTSRPGRSRAPGRAALGPEARRRARPTTSPRARRTAPRT